MTWIVNGYAMQHFVLDEFRCPCCYRKLMAPHALVMFDKWRDRAKVPVTVSSGYRCMAHNAKVGGHPGSSHLRGLAMDTPVTDSGTRFRLIEAAIAVGINRIGVAPGFLHVDVDPSLPQCVVWTYE